MIKSVHPSDAVFGYLCEDPDGKNTTLGFYRFEARDVKGSHLKTIAISEQWVTNLEQMELSSPVLSLTFTRSMSGRLKVIVANEKFIAIINSRDGKLESTINLEDEGLTNKPLVKVFPVQLGFGVIMGNEIIVKRLTSAGKVDQSFSPCQTFLPLSDAVYEFRNPGFIFALTETSNELVIFQLSSGQGEC